MNVVVVETTADDLFMKRTQDNGVDFTFDGIRQLRITVRYQRVLHKVVGHESPAIVSNFINGNDPNSDPSTDDSENENPVRVGSVFPHNNALIVSFHSIIMELSRTVNKSMVFWKCHCRQP